MKRLILITGATGKVGRVLTSHFLNQGDSVIGTSRTDEGLDRLRLELGNLASNFHGVPADLTLRDAVATVCSALKSRGLSPTGLVNNARSTRYLKVQEDGLVSRDDFCDEYLMDVFIPYELTMRLATQPGSQLTNVVNVGSQYGAVAANPHLYANPSKDSPINYGVAKAALMHLTKELAVRLVDKGISVNCVALGGIEGRVDEAFKQRYSVLCPLGRMLTEAEVVGPIDLMLSPKCNAVTGQTLMADGGWTLW